MCFDIAVTKMQAESKQRDTEHPGESDTHGEMENGREERTEDHWKPEGPIDRERCREREILFTVKFSYFPA